MKKKKIILWSILGIPFCFIAGYILFVIIWLHIPDSDATKFKRITRHQMPDSIKNFQVHQYFDPTLGEGIGMISFETSHEEGEKLIQNLKFTERTNNKWSKDMDELNLKIENPLYYSNSEDIWNMVTIKRDKEATKFIWKASF